MDSKENKETKKGLSTVWIVVITVVVTLIVVGTISLIWYFGSKFIQLQRNANNQTTTEENNEESEENAEPLETPTEAAESFLKSIFNTFPDSKVDLTKAKTYLSNDLIAQVDSTKESYWDLHGYIHSGPCSVEVSPISSTDTTALVEITTEWGEECYGMAEPYYRYEMEIENDNWIITKIIQLKPAGSESEIVPRDF